MATWQFDVCVLPAGAQVPEEERANLLLDGAAKYWKAQDASIVLALLARLGGGTPSWSPAVHLWGDEQKSCVSLTVSEDGTIEDLRVRVDMRAPHDEPIPRFLEIVRLQGWELVTELGEPVEPVLEQLLKATRGSIAAQYVRDPASAVAHWSRRRGRN